MNDQSREWLDTYYAQAASWSEDRHDAIRSSRRIAWWIATAATIVAVLEAAALLLLMPLKTVQPYTLLVDRTTGYVQALKPLDPGTIAPDRALTQSFLVQYVIAREGFDLATANTNYRKVALLSAGRARSTYLSQMQVSNPASPLVALPRGTVIDVRVKSVSPIAKDVALVRFDLVHTDMNGSPQPPQPWIAVVRYRWSSAPMSLEDRFVNPLGFQVTSYRRDAEALPRTEVGAAEVATPLQSSLTPGAPPALLQPTGGSIEKSK